MLRAFAITTLVATAFVAAGSAQSRNRDVQRTGDARCSDGSNERLVSFCDVREDTIGGANPLDVDAGTNGGIRVRGWDRDDVLVRTRIIRAWRC